MRKKEKNRVLVKVDDFVVAEHRWIQFNGLDQFDFRKFLNQSTVLHGTGKNGADWSYWVSPTAARKIEMLTGPHWLTILKMWKVKSE